MAAARAQELKEQVRLLDDIISTYKLQRARALDTLSQVLTGMGPEALDSWQEVAPSSPPSAPAVSIHAEPNVREDYESVRPSDQPPDSSTVQPPQRPRFPTANRAALRSAVVPAPTGSTAA